MWKLKAYPPFPFGHYQPLIKRGRCLKTLNSLLAKLDHVYAYHIYVYRKNAQGRWYRFSVRRWRALS